jgi:hypothetical protein
LLKKGDKTKIQLKWFMLVALLTLFTTIVYSGSEAILKQKPTVVEAAKEIKKEEPATPPKEEPKTPPPAPKPVTPPAPKVYAAGVEQWRPLVAKYFPANQVENAMIILKNESGGDPYQISPTDDHGLMQLNCSFIGSKGAGGWCTWFGVTREQLKDPELNVRLASEVWKRSGWGKWTTSKYLYSG